MIILNPAEIASSFPDQINCKSGKSLILKETKEIRKKNPRKSVIKIPENQLNYTFAWTLISKNQLESTQKKTPENR